MLRIVANNADMWNSFGTPEIFRHKIAARRIFAEASAATLATIYKSVLSSTANGTGPFELSDAHRQIDEYVAAGVTHIIFLIRR